MAADLIPASEPRALTSRKLTDETTRKFGYFTAKVRGTPCQVAPYYDRQGNIVAQKVRFPDKEFFVAGDIKDALPFGAHAFPKGGKKIVVTEGEIDAMSMSQVQNNKWPAVSISCGADRPTDDDGNELKATKIKKYFAKMQDYFDGFEEVILMFDNDAAGRFSAQAAAEVLGPKAKIAELPLKDASEMLCAGRTEDLINAMWRAKVYRPEGVVEMSSLREKVLQRPRSGLTTPWAGLDRMTHGHQLGRIVTLVAGTGVGKTDVLMQTVTRLVMDHHEGIGCFLLESPSEYAAQVIAGKHAGKRFHVPDAGWTDDELLAAFDSVVGSGKVFLYDSFGANEWSPIKAKMEYLIHSEGIKYFVLDHLTALTAGEEDQRVALDRMMEDMASFVVKHNVTIYLVSHLNRPIGKSHEEGGRVTLAHLRNSGSIAMWSWIVLALERDQQAEDETVRYTTTVRCLKQRSDGTKVGDTFFIRYDKSTGLLNEVSAADAPDPNKAGAFGFDEAPQQGGGDF